MKKFCCVLLALLPLTAFAYSIDVQKNLNGLKIDYETYDTDKDIGSIKVVNFGDVDANCKVVFNNGPEAPRTRNIEIPAHKHTNATAKFSREIIRLRIDLSCSPK
ncbi:3-phosphoglycerate kinase [Pseudomonas sp. RSB 5.4]|uniref:3-phosphoglycerate kinase n=1 Tax=Pseudomonas sp. RSB 5.4 TaxID=3127459 RepID=UPI0030CBA9BE